MGRLTGVQIDAVNAKAEKLRKENPQWRRGQAFFNALYMSYREAAEEIRGGKYDPFYVDAKLKDCIRFLMSERKKKEKPDETTPFTDEVIEKIATTALSEFWDKVNDGLFDYEATDEQKEKAHEKIVQFALNVL